MSVQAIVKTVQGILALFAGWLSIFLGGLDGLIFALALFVVLDYVLGVMISVINQKLSSKIGFKGICKKVAMFILVGVGFTIDKYVIGNGVILRTTVLMFFIANEGISIIENCAVLGLPIPQKLKDILIQLKEDKWQGIKENVNVTGTEVNDEKRNL